MEDIPIIPVTRLDLRFEPVAWRFAVERRDAIDAHFAKLRLDKPAMFNGRVLLLRHGAIADGTLSGAYLETDFASFIAWRDWGFPDKTMRNCFPMAALRSSDGALEALEALVRECGAEPVNVGVAGDSPRALRAMLARFLRRSLPQLKVLSYAEVPDTRNIKVVNLIGGQA